MITVAIAASAIPLGFFSQVRAGEFTPREAFVDGCPHRYYGSENKWNRRFFKGQTANIQA